jgi:hypothetical protein
MTTNSNLNDVVVQDGKAVSLVAAFTAAREAARAAGDANDEDGGTSNFDTPIVFLPRVRGSRIEKAAAEAGVDASTVRYCGATWWFVRVPLDGQGNCRTRMAEAATKALKDAGLNATTWYQMD